MLNIYIINIKHFDPIVSFFQNGNFERSSMEFYRSTGEGEEVPTAITEEAGFGIPVFITGGLYRAMTPDSVTLHYGISRQQNILDTLRLLYRISQKSEEQTIVFETAFPRWNPRTIGFEVRELTISCTLIMAKDSPFIIVSEYEEVRDIIEGA